MSEYIERKAAINKVSEIPAHFDSGAKMQEANDNV